MKKTALFIWLLALCLLCAPFAVAEGPVARSDAFAAYTDGMGHLYLTGKAEAINSKPANSVVGMDAYRVLYLSTDDFLDTQDLYAVDLQSLKESLIATDVMVACLGGEDTAFYVTGANRKQLVRADLRREASPLGRSEASPLGQSLANEVIYTAAEPIDRLYMSAEGLVFQLVDRAATMLYVEDPEGLASRSTGRFEIYSGGMPRSGAIGERYEVFLTDDAELYLKSLFNYSTSLIDSDVTAFAWLNDTVYYLTRTGSALRLKAYDPSARTSRIVLTPGVKMKDQLTASGRSLFMLSADNTVCRVDIAKGALGVFKRYSDLTAYSLPEEYNVDGLYIEGMSGQLNVYARLMEKASKPTFSFIEFESEADVAAPVLRLIDTLKLTGEQTASDQLKPTPQYATLSRGSRGDAVSAIQQPLKDLGYYDYYVDGIFGPRTQTAVQLLQFDLERPVTGVADAELQRIILSGRLSAYDPYHELARGNRGMRVRQMQERLRELGYLADAADGIFGPRTLKAVQLFQYENGLPETSAATRDTLKRLYSDGASRCSSYIDLYPGDTGYRVRELNNRLRDLYYLENSPGSTYSSQTASAVRVFQRTAGLRETGYASQAVQRLLFSDDAPEAPGYIVLRRGDDNERVARLQRRLRDLNYYDGPVDGYFDRQTKDAVALFQKKVGLKPTGIATVRTQQLLFDKDAPEYVEPTVISEPDIYVEVYDFEDDGIYFISEESAPDGYVVFSWDVEGSVDHYGIRVNDSQGNVYIDKDTMMTSTGVSLATLDFNEVYTLRVRAYPEDGDSKHVTQAEIDFARLEPAYEDDLEVETVGLPEIIIDPIGRTEGGVYYLLPGDITFDWHAEGDVDSYDVRIEDESGNAVVDENTSEHTASISSSAMSAGEIYTIYVSAIPEDGNKKASRSNSVRFALPEVELPEPEPEPEPILEPEPEQIDESEAIEVQEAIELPEETLEESLELVPTLDSPAETEDEENTGESSEAQEIGAEVELPAEEKPVEAANESEESETAPGDLTEASAGETIPGEAVELTPEEASEEASAEGIPLEPEEAPEEVSAEGIPLEPEVQETAPVTEPVITFDHTQETRGGISYVSGEVLTMSWQSEGDVAEYQLSLLDSSGNLLDSRAVEATSLSGYTSALDPNEVYTLKVTAIPAGGSEADGATASARFALYTAAPGDAGVDEPIEETLDDDVDEAWQNAEEEYVEPEDDDTAPEEEYLEPVSDVAVPIEEYLEQVNEDNAPEEIDLEPEDEDTAPEEVYLEPESEDTAPEDEYLEYGDEQMDTEDEEANAGDLEGVDLSEDEIIELQFRLESLGWLKADSYTPGTLDPATIYAIGEFQSHCNDTLALDLPMIDPMDPIIDADTLDALKDADERCANPSAALALDDASEGDVNDALEEEYDELGEQDESGDDDYEADGEDALDVSDEEANTQ